MSNALFHAIPILGAGVVNPVAVGLAEFGSALREGAPKLSSLTGVPIPRGRSTVGLVSRPEFTGGEKGLRMASHAVEEALKGSGLTSEQLADTGLILATMAGDSHAAENAYPRLLAVAHGTAEPTDDLRDDFLRYPNGAILEGLTRKFGLGGPCFVISNACASGNIAVGLALDYLRTGQCAAIIVVGVEVMRAGMLWGAERAGFVGDALRPFHPERNGAILGEGAAAIVVATPEMSAHQPFGWVEGFGSVCDRGAAAITLAEDGSGLLRAMQLALIDAERPISDIEYVNAHAPGTPMIDAIECKAVAQLCDADQNKVAINSTKSITTHLSGASAITEIIATLLQLSGGFIHANAGVIEPDPSLALKPVGATALDRKVSFALSNACGGGGLNTSIALSLNPLRRASCDAPVLPQPLAITGVGDVTGDIRWQPWSGADESAEERDGRLASFDVCAHYPPETNFQYMNRAAQLAAAAGELALRDAGIASSLPCRDDRFAAIFGTYLGGAPQASQVMCDGLMTKPNAITPSMSLDHGIHLGAALVCRHFGLTGTTYTVTGSRRSGLQALEIAKLTLEQDRAEAALVCGYDASNELQANLTKRLAKQCGIPVDAASAVVLERNDKLSPGRFAAALLLDIKTFATKSPEAIRWLLERPWQTLYLASSIDPQRFRPFVEAVYASRSGHIECVKPTYMRWDPFAGLAMAALVDAVHRKTPAAIVALDDSGITIAVIAPGG